jgi:hypothetical protein
MTRLVKDIKVKEKKTLSVEKHVETLREWRIKVSKAMHVLCTAIENEQLEYIRESPTTKVIRDILVMFSKKSNARL